MPKKILITGGAGFIGSHLAKRCIDLGHAVTVVDNLSTGNKSNLPKGAEFVRLDIEEKDFARNFPSNKFDVVMHLAAQSSGEVSASEPDLDRRVNFESTREILAWAQTRVSQFLYASSMAVYGDSQIEKVREDDPCHPLSNYGRNKLESEKLVEAAHSPSLSTTNFRMFSVYGPGQNMNNLKQGMVSIYLAYALKGGPILVKGASDRFRDFVFIDDVVEAWISALNQKNKAGGKTFNIGTGVQTRVSELLRNIILTLGHDPDAFPIDYQAPTPADQKGITADISKIKRELGWSPKTLLEDGLIRMVSWAKVLSS